MLTCVFVINLNDRVIGANAINLFCLVRDFVSVRLILCSMQYVHKGVLGRVLYDI